MYPNPPFPGYASYALFCWRLLVDPALHTLVFGLYQIRFEGFPKRDYPG
jgi:hypothetical protein